MTKGGKGGKGKKAQNLGVAENLSSELKDDGSPGEAVDRRPLRFWQPFNDWWRQELEHLGRRPNAQEILVWYNANAYLTWRDEAPTLQETRVHAKCLRSLPLVRDYFRNYRAKKRSSSNQVPTDDPDGAMGGDEEDTPPQAEPRQEASATPAEAFRPAPTLNQYAAHTAARPGVDFIHPALPMLNPAAALWSQAAQAAHAASLDPNQQELLRNITLQQLQHAAAVQQQLTLAALAQNFALSRNALSSGLTQQLALTGPEAAGASDGDGAGQHGDPSNSIADMALSEGPGAAHLQHLPQITDADAYAAAGAGPSGQAAVPGGPGGAHDLGMLADASEVEAMAAAAVAAEGAGAPEAHGELDRQAALELSHSDLVERVLALQSHLRAKDEAVQQLQAELAASRQHHAPPPGALPGVPMLQP